MTDRLERIHVPHDFNKSGLSQVKQWKGMHIVNHINYVVIDLFFGINMLPSLRVTILAVVLLPTCALRHPP